MISPGLSGFPAGSVYVAYPNTAGTSTVIASIPATGGAPTAIGTIAGIFDHVGLVFDLSGIYGGGLLALTEDGRVYSIQPAISGYTTTLAGTISGLGSGAHVESPNIAPVGFGPKGGLLWVVNEKESGAGDDAIYAVSATFAATKVVDVPLTTGLTPPDRAESLAFVASSACSTPVPGVPGGTGTLLDAFYPTAVAMYNAPAIAAYFNTEFSGIIYKLTANGATSYNSPTVFDSGVGGQEHLAATVCLPAFFSGRWTGGGSVFERDGTRVTHGFELHCDVNNLPNNLEINWASANNFHLDTLTSATCFLDPNVGSPHPPSADFNTIIATGTGSFNNQPGATISFTLTDAGEPGNKDTATFLIKVGSTTVLSVSGNLDKGNQQAHSH